MEKDLKIAVAGTGYVGLSMATLLAQHHEVTAVDVVPEKIDLINHRQSPIQDDYIEQYLREKPLRLTATLDADMAYKPGEKLFRYHPRRRGHRQGSQRQSVGHDGRQIHHSCGLYAPVVCEICTARHGTTQLVVCTRVPQREQSPLR